MELMNILTLIISLLVAVGFIGVIFRMFEKSKPSVEYIVMLAVLIAIAVVANFIGSILHIDLVFFIVIMAGVVFGKESGFLVGALSIIVHRSWLHKGHCLLLCSLSDSSLRG